MGAKDTGNRAGKQRNRLQQKKSTQDLFQDPGRTSGRSGLLDSNVVWLRYLGQELCHHKSIMVAL